MLVAPENSPDTSTMPLASTTTSYASSWDKPPIWRAHWHTPAELNLATKPSPPPALTRLVVPKLIEPPLSSKPKDPATYELPAASTVTALPALGRVPPAVCM